MVLTVGLLQRGARTRAPAPAADAGTVTPAAASRCAEVDLPTPPVLPQAEHPPALLRGHAPVRLYLDGAQEPLQAVEPVRLAPGEHALRAEAPEAEGLALSFRVRPFEPVLLHATWEAQAGITVVFQGLECLVCGPRRAKPWPLAPAPAREPPAAALAGAAQALRRADTDRAAELLAQVPEASRSAVLYRRLAAWLHAATGQPDAARPEAERAAELGSGELAALLEAHRQRREEEQERRPDVPLLRWNALAERFGRLVQGVPDAAPGQTGALAARLEELGAQVKAARSQKDLARQEALVDEGEAAVRAWVRAVREQRATDCDFQARVTKLL